MNAFTKSEIDRLGDRLRGDEITENDLQLLDAYRHSFNSAYKAVVATIENQLGLKTTQRPEKSMTSISDKLRRESIRLSQMQDIAGCRAIVPDIGTQDDAMERVRKMFDETTLFDRRKSPSHGYRAVHVVVRRDGMPVEIQIRTALQHRWAELSEKLSDIVDPRIKYGGGPEKFSSLLLELSATVGEMEELERELLAPHTSQDDPQVMTQIKSDLSENKRRFTLSLESVIERVRSWKDA